MLRDSTEDFLELNESDCDVVNGNENIHVKLVIFEDEGDDDVNNDI